MLNVPPVNVTRLEAGAVVIPFEQDAATGNSSTTISRRHTGSDAIAAFRINEFIDAPA